MCGIAGFIGVGDRDDITLMTDALKHRGPDGQGFHFDEENQVFLGHRRLSIRDLKNGAQPMWDIQKKKAIVFNGEIYNDLELRRELESLGYKFSSSHSDTEVLLYGYIHWGPRILEKLNGMFAFAILDYDQQRLFLARDRFGEKPLYYCKKNDVFAFSSELSSLVKHQYIASEPSQKSLQKLFAYGFIPAPHSLYINTYKLPAGHFMHVDLKTLKSSQACYWDFELTNESSFCHSDEKELIEELETLIDTAVDRRLVSDVPIGLFLSGGVDSSTILSAASKSKKIDRPHTFTIGFEEASFDESAFAKQVAQQFHSIHRLETLNSFGAESTLHNILGQLDEPFADASILPTYQLCKFAKQHVTVALSGDGGDELFAGYDPFKALGPAVFYNTLIPKPLRFILEKSVQKLPISENNMALDFKLKRTLIGLSQIESCWAPAWMGPIDPREFSSYFTQHCKAEELFSEAMELWDSTPSKSRVDKLLRYFTKLYLQDNILFKSDRASMMNSLETRAIFLDNDIVDFCSRLPTKYKMKFFKNKYLLKKGCGETYWKKDSQ
ncbi:asparagine synthase (glutamine-hydrolyzing) [Alphaproteobacteria bacterium]|nr:asparagine synthase (glutamine-hydrolyzing) [Alphaproteobacteria bacterium]